jgi:hypothetical protein
MKHLLLACCSFIVAVNSYGASPTLEQLVAAGTIWNAESANGTSSDCREHIRFRDVSQFVTASSESDNEDYRPGDMAFYMEEVAYDAQGKPNGYIQGEIIPYRPKAPEGKSTMRDEGGSNATINNKPDRIILEQKATALLGSYTYRFTFHKESGRIEYYSKASGVPEEKCSYLIAEPARQPTSVVESDPSVPRGDTSSSAAARTPGTAVTPR